MEGEILVLFRFNGPSLTVRLQVGSSFDEFKEKLAKKGVPHETLSMNMTIKAIGPQYSECVLSDNDDFGNLFFLLRETGVCVCTIDAGNFIETVPVPLTESGVICTRAASASISLNHSTQNITKGAHVSEILERNEPQIGILPREKKVLLTAPWAQYITHEGQSFEGGAEEFRIKLTKYMIEKGFKFTYVRNTNKQVIAECAKKEDYDCKWFINATHSKLNDWFYIRTFSNEHRCPMDVRSHKRLSAEIIGLQIVNKVKDKPSVTANEIIDLFKEEYGLNITYKQAWRAKEKAQDCIYGCHIDSYHELKWYLHHLLLLNNGSRIEFEEVPVLNKKTGETVKRFLRAFVALRPAIHGFSYCRPMLFIDGTFLSGRYGGVLLSATAKDGENGLFPVAFAIVDQENKDNWRWFLLNLLLIIPEGRDVIFVSDRNIGLMQLFQYEFPELKNFYCLQHLKNNLRDRFKGRALNPYAKEKLVNLLSECARAPTKHIFEQKLSEFLKSGGNIAKSFLQGLPLEKWAFSHAPCVRFGEMTFNAAESYNNWIKEARGLPITQCVDQIRSQTMELFHERRTKAAEWSGPLTGGLQKQWNAALQDSRDWNIRRSSEYVFEFLCNPTIVVNLEKKTCDCYKWQFHGFPCIHGITAIHLSKKNLEEFVDSYYLASSFKSSYEEPIVPVSTILKHTEFADLGQRVYPPEKKRQPGRPKTKRIPSKGEFGSCKRRRYKCKKCGGFNHNSKKCKEPIPG